MKTWILHTFRIYSSEKETKGHKGLVRPSFQWHMTSLSSYMFGGNVNRRTVLCNMHVSRQKIIFKNPTPVKGCNARRHAVTGQIPAKDSTAAGYDITYYCYLCFSNFWRIGTGQAMICNYMKVRVSVMELDAGSVMVHSLIHHHPYFLNSAGRIPYCFHG